MLFSMFFPQNISNYYFNNNDFIKSLEELKKKCEKYQNRLKTPVFIVCESGPIHAHSSLLKVSSEERFLKLYLHFRNLHFSERCLKNAAHCSKWAYLKFRYLGPWEPMTS